MLIFRIIARIRDLCELDTSQKIILMHLGCHCTNEHGRYIYVKIATLCRQTRLSKREVLYTLAELKESGWIGEEKERKEKVKGYRINLERLYGFEEATKLEKMREAPKRQKNQKQQEAVPVVSDISIEELEDFQFRMRAFEQRIRRRILDEEEVQRRLWYFKEKLKESYEYGE